MISKTPTINIAPPLYVVFVEFPSEFGGFNRSRIGAALTLESAWELVNDDKAAMRNTMGGFFSPMKESEIAKRKYAIWKSKGWEKVS